jgi:hypothetical protein
LIEKLGVSLLQLAAGLAGIFIIIDTQTHTTPAPIHCVFGFVIYKQYLFSPVFVFWANHYVSYVIVPWQVSKFLWCFLNYWLH